jgi:cell wall-associated NlpC family hydrolase
MLTQLACAKSHYNTAITQPIPVSHIADFQNYPPALKKLILKGRQLSEQNLTYLYGSANPKNKGMDCSGTIYYLLSQANIQDVPRQSDQIFDWANHKGKLYRVSHHDFQSSDFSKLKPGDLLFWSGTYAVHRASPISHVMIYLGKNEKGERLMFGASNGRPYQGKRMWGVSVFDFKLPTGHGPQKFVGYSCIPNLTCHVN